MQTYQYGLDVVSDNLANISTFGYRGNSTEFATIFDGQLNATMPDSVTGNFIGTGSRVQATTMDESYGSFMNTDSGTDFAIGGDGWFGVSSNSGAMYTRAGAFTFDKDRNLVSYDGMYLLGTSGKNINGNVLTKVVDSVPLDAPSQQGKITLPIDLKIDAIPTTEIDFLGNLNAKEELIRFTGRVVSADGSENILTLDYTLSEQQPEIGTSWDIKAILSDKDDGTVLDSVDGISLFNESGALKSFNIPLMDNKGNALTVDLGEEFSGVTSMNNLEVSFGSEQNGKEAGTVNGYDVNSNGEIIATFDNGVMSSVGRVAIFHFQNDQGLERISGTHFKESSNSGDPIFYTNESGEFILGADFKSFSLETSNMQFEQGLTELIIMQRSLDANAKSITTGDELIQKALQMDA
jgi:flagellar hook protein FlgE